MYILKQVQCHLIPLEHDLLIQQHPKYQHRIWPTYLETHLLIFKTKKLKQAQQRMILIRASYTTITLSLSGCSCLFYILCLI